MSATQRSVPRLFYILVIAIGVYANYRIAGTLESFVLSITTTLALLYLASRFERLKPEVAEVLGICPVLAQADSFILVANCEGNIIDVNQYVCRVLGKTKNQLLKENLSFFGLNLDKVKTGLCNAETLINDKIISLSTIQAITEQGRFLVVTGVDITSKVERETMYVNNFKEINEKTNRYEAMLRTLNMGVVYLKGITDDSFNLIDFEVVYSNQLAQNLGVLENTKVSEQSSFKLENWIDIAKKATLLSDGVTEEFYSPKFKRVKLRVQQPQLTYYSLIIALDQ